MKKSEKKRLKTWNKFCKTNYDCDYTYLFEIINFKLKMMRKTITKNSISENTDVEKISTQIKEVNKILKRVIKDNYSIIECDKLNEKFGVIETKFNFIKDPNNKKLSKLDVVHVGLKDEDKEAYDKEFVIAMDSAEQNRKMDLMKAFNLIAKNCWFWWD